MKFENVKIFDFNSLKDENVNYFDFKKLRFKKCHGTVNQSSLQNMFIVNKRIKNNILFADLYVMKCCDDYDIVYKIFSNKRKDKLKYLQQEDNKIVYNIELDMNFEIIDNILNIYEIFGFKIYTKL